MDKRHVYEIINDINNFKEKLNNCYKKDVDEFRYYLEMLKISVDALEKELNE